MFMPSCRTSEASSFCRRRHGGREGSFNTAQQQQCKQHHQQANSNLISSTILVYTTISIFAFLLTTNTIGGVGGRGGLYEGLLASAASLPFSSIPDQDNFTFLFTTDTILPDSQPNILTGMAAAFHEANTIGGGAHPGGGQTIAAPESRSYFKLLVTNQTEIASNAILDKSPSIGAASLHALVSEKMADYNALEAYRIANPSNTMDDYLISISANPNDPADTKAHRAMAGRIMGFTFGSGLASFSTVETSIQNNYSGYSLVTTTTETLNRENFINLRSQAGIDVPVIINLAFHRVGLQCTSILALSIDLGDSAIVQMKEQLSTGGHPFTVVTRTSSDYYDIGQLVLGLATKPSCILLIDAAVIVDPTIPALSALTTHDMTNTSIVIAGISYQSKYDVTKSVSFQNLYSTQIAPDPNDGTSAFAVRGKKAIEEYLAVMPSDLYGNISYANCSLTNSSVTNVLPTVVSGSGCRIESHLESRELDFQMMEGYLLGRHLVEAIRTTPNATMESIRASIFRQRLFLFDDFDLGPYSNKCSSGGSIPCFCTSGIRTFFSSRVNGTTGRSYAIKDRAELGEYNVATTTFPYSSCLDTIVNIRRAFNIIILELADSVVDIATNSDPYYSMYVSSLEKAFYSIGRDATFNTLGSFLVTRIKVSGIGSTVAGGPVTLSASDLDLITTHVSRFRPFAIVPTFIGARTENLTNIARISNSAVFDASYSYLRSTTEVGPGDQNVVSLDASMADYLHSAAYFTSRQTSTSSIGIIADSDLGATNAVKSLHTFNRSPSDQVVSTSASQLTSFLSSFLAKTRAIIIITTSDAAVLQTLFQTIASATSIGVNTKVVVAASESILFQAANETLRDAPTANQEAVYFASYMKAWWLSTSPIGLRSVAYAFNDGISLSSDGVSIDLPTFRSIPAHSKASQVAMSLQALGLQAIQGARQDVLAAPSLVESAYIGGTLDVGTTPFGLFTNTTCSTDEERLQSSRLCECRDGLSELYVHSVQSLLAAYSGTTINSTVQGSNLFTSQFRIVGCSIHYQPLVTTSSDSSTQLIIGLAVGVGGLLLLVVATGLIILCCCMGRSNRRAPQNEQLPFTMVFTDIQSSTALWARAPAAMAKAVDLHHEIIRSNIDLNHGYEVKTIGDSFMVAFKDPVNAVEFSLEVQSTLFDDPRWSDELDGVYKEILHDQLDLYNRARDLAINGGIIAATSNNNHQEDMDEMMGTGVNGIEDRLESEENTPTMAPLPQPSKQQRPQQLIGSPTSENDDDAGGLTAFSFRSGGGGGGNSPNSIAHEYDAKMMESITDPNKATINSLFSMSVASPRQNNNNNSAQPGTDLLAAAQHEELFFIDTHRILLEMPEEYAKQWRGVRVRVGIHTGFGEIKKDTVSGGFDYYGTVVNTAARVEGVGHGGQILITTSAYTDIKFYFDGRQDVSVLDLGEQVLRGLDTPVGITQVSLERFAARRFPPLRLDVENYIDENDDEDSWLKESSVSVPSTDPTTTPKNTVSSGGASAGIDYLDPDNLAENIANGAFIGFGHRNSATKANGAGGVLPMIHLDVQSQSTAEGAGGGGGGSINGDGSFLDYYKFLVVMLSTLPPQKAQSLLSDICRPWRIKLPKEKAILERARRKTHRKQKKKSVASKSGDIFGDPSIGELTKEDSLIPDHITEVAKTKYFVLEVLRKILPVHRIQMASAHYDREKKLRDKIKMSSVSSFATPNLLPRQLSSTSVPPPPLPPPGGGPLLHNGSGNSSNYRRPSSITAALAGGYIPNGQRLHPGGTIGLLSRTNSTNCMPRKSSNSSTMHLSRHTSSADFSGGAAVLSSLSPETGTTGCLSVTDEPQSRRSSNSSKKVESHSTSRSPKSAALVGSVTSQ